MRDCWNVRGHVRACEWVGTRALLSEGGSWRGPDASLSFPAAAALPALPCPEPAGSPLLRLDDRARQARLREPEVGERAGEELAALIGRGTLGLDLRAGRRVGVVVMCVCGWGGVGCGGVWCGGVGVCGGSRPELHTRALGMEGELLLQSGTTSDQVHIHGL